MSVRLLSVVVFVSLLPAVARAGSFCGAAGADGSNAISMDDASFVEWANGCTVKRGPLNISNTSLGYASYGVASNAVGKAQGNSTNVVSLGDGGSALLTFDKAIANGKGYDFAVFENGFASTFLELAFVEVSSDGTNFFRFHAVSETQTTTQVGGYGTLDPTCLNNLAGKYMQGYGTPFDLTELASESSLLDVNNVKYVRVVDVVGSIADGYCTYDSLGNKINDPWPTAFASGGFDLDAVGVMHQVPEPGSLVGALAALIGMGTWRSLRRPRCKRP